MTQKLSPINAAVHIFIIVERIHTNDIEMIEHCGYGVAMENSLDIVKEKADFVTLSNEENGVAKALSQIIDIR